MRTARWAIMSPKYLESDTGDGFFLWLASFSEHPEKVHVLVSQGGSD